MSYDDDDDEEPVVGELVGLPDLSALGDMDGFGDLFEQAQKMMQAQAEMAEQVVEGQAGGGAVRIQATGSGEFRRVVIARDAVDPDDVDMLQDLVLAALHDVSVQIVDLQRGALGNISLGGMDLGGLLGGPADG
jgi:DNA-binding YbaB/EbfC family protein